jgi:PhnB protein
MTKVSIYLTFDGNCEAAFEFYKSVFGNEFSDINRFSEIPPQEGQPPVPEDLGNRIMHVVLPVNEQMEIFGSDTMPDHQHIPGNNFSLSISTDSKENADDLFNKLSADAEVTMPITDTFWGAYFGMLKDKFGIQWMVNYDYPKTM